MKKERNLYKVKFFSIEKWDDETNAPEKLVPVDDSIGVSQGIVTADFASAYRFYRREAKNLFNRQIDLDIVPIMVDDDEWTVLQKKEKLDPDDFEVFEVLDSSEPTIAWHLNFAGHNIGEDGAAAELLKIQSENFNMRVICEKAGVSYSTFRGFKNNSQPFSAEKVNKLLKCMHDIGVQCWNEDME